jgi:CRP/FNR family cyclic AMP-dependent transcriptional regulator
VLCGLALALGQRGDWTDKLALLIELGEKADDALVTEYIDEIVAEILESNTAINDLFGGFADAVSAFRGLVHVTQGRCQINNPRSCLTAFNDFMAKRPMPLTTSVLLARVARTLSGIRPMTREGPAAKLDAFKGLLRELVEQAGIAGGPNLAGALTGRARMVFADPDDLSVPDALNHILALLPNRAVQLGFLLDVLASPVREKHEQAVLGVLARLVKQLTTLASLFPKDMSPAQVESSLSELREKMMSDGLPEKYRNLFSQTLDRLVARGDAPATGADEQMTYKMEDAPVTTTTATPPTQVQRREAAPGEVLFEEGDEADVAYLILDGEVDIYRKAGNQEVLLATLRRGDIVGEMSLIDNQPRMASARIKSDTKMTVISREDLAARLGRLAETDKVLRRIIDVFVDRLRGQARMYE